MIHFNVKGKVLEVVGCSIYSPLQTNYTRIEQSRECSDKEKYRYIIDSDDVTK